MRPCSSAGGMRRRRQRCRQPEVAQQVQQGIVDSHWLYSVTGRMRNWFTHLNNVLVVLMTCSACQAPYRGRLCQVGSGCPALIEDMHSQAGAGLVTSAASWRSRWRCSRGPAERPIASQLLRPAPVFGRTASSAAVLIGAASWPASNSQPGRDQGTLCCAAALTTRRHGSQRPARCWPIWCWWQSCLTGGRSCGSKWLSWSGRYRGVIAATTRGDSSNEVVVE